MHDVKKGAVLTEAKDRFSALIRAVDTTLATLGDVPSLAGLKEYRAECQERLDGIEQLLLTYRDSAKARPRAGRTRR